MVQRFGSLDVMSNKGPPSTPPTPPTPSGHAAGRQSGRDALEPGTYPRTLELWCGRAGKSAHEERQGNHAFYLNWDRSAVEESFGPPDYIEPGHPNAGEVKPRTCPHEAKPQLRRPAPLPPLPVRDAPRLVRGAAGLLPERPRP